MFNISSVFLLILKVFKAHVIHSGVFFHLERSRLMDYCSGAVGLVFKGSQILRLPCIMLVNN